MRFLYNLSIVSYNVIIHLAAIFNKKKAKQWVRGRNHCWENIASNINTEEKKVWFHVSSLGEFEQGRTLIEEFKKKHPRYKIVLTFFSPSGYEVRKNYEFADAVFYLPIDTPKNAARFVTLVNPSIVFFVKYDFWFNYIRCVAEKNIPLFFVSALFRNNQHFFKWYGGWFRKHLHNVKHFYVQNKVSEELLRSIGINQVTVCGDTRFDRVYSITQNVKPFPLIKKFCGDSPVFICGSTWPADEDIIIPLMSSGKAPFKYIIEPHIVDEAHIAAISSKLNVPFLLYSEIEKSECDHCNVLIINCIGILSHVYQYAHIAYIGGGFGNGIHNIQEPATFGMPVIFGPKYHKFREAIDLIEEGGAFCVKSEIEFKDVVQKFINNPSLLKRASEITKNYIKMNVGATEAILNHLEKSIQLPN